MHTHTHVTMLQLSFPLIAVEMYYGINGVAKSLEVNTFLAVMLYSIIKPPSPSCNKSETYKNRNARCSSRKEMNWYPGSQTDSQTDERFLATIKVRYQVGPLSSVWDSPDELLTRRETQLEKIIPAGATGARILLCICNCLHDSRPPQERAACVVFR